MKPSKKMGLFMLLIFTVALIQYHLASSWLAGGSNSGTGISYKGQASSEEVLLAAVDKLSLEDSIAASIGQKVFRDLVLQLGRELLASGVCVHASETVTVTQKINKTVIPRIYIITPTYRRPEQIPELTRMAQTLMHVQNIHWLVIEDAENKTQLVTALLRRSGIPHEHLVAPMPEVYKNKKGPKPRGVSNRNKGLEWIRANARNGVVYFADDDNTYDIHLFEEVRTTQRVAMWPVGLCTKFGLSSPVVLNGSFVGFYDGWVGGRKFPVDMAGFAVNVQFLLQRPKASMPYKPGYEEDGFLKSLAPFDPKEIELKAKNCTEILVWHTQTKKKEAATPVDMKKYNATNLALLKDLIVPKLQKRYLIAAGVVLFICFLAGIIQVIVKFSSPQKVTTGLVPPNPEVPLPPSWSVEHRFNTAAVCSDGPPCAEIGRDIFKKNGTVVDAAIATLFCNGLVNSQSMGLGGGFLMTLYLRDEKKAITLDARESAPLRATRDMYNGTKGPSQAGPLASGVPGELKGYWEAYLKYGSLPWADLIEPTIKLCEEGYVMNKHQFDSLDMRKEYVRTDPILREMFVNPENGNFYRAGHTIRPKKICNTYRIIAKEGGNSLYNGSLAKMFAADVQGMGGIITEEDLAKYSVRWADPITVDMRRDKLKLFTIPPPGSGILLGFILNILEGYNFTSENVKDINSTILTYHRMIEAFKFAFAKRTELGDPAFGNTSQMLRALESKEYAHKIQERIDDHNTSSDPAHYGVVNFTNDDHGTAHVSIIAPNGDAASITSTVNIYFGAGVTSPQTGIILNSGMDDFSIPGMKNYFGLPFSPQNAIEPGKRALSSMCPSIIVDKHGDVRLVIGASGGTKITTAVAFVIMRHFWFGETIKQSVDAGRIHHQVFPMKVQYEYGVLDQVVKGLEALGHETIRYKGRGSIICALAKIHKMIIANADFRKGGDVFGF